MAPSPEEMAASMIANLPERTGRSLEQWIDAVRASGLETHGEIVALLKSEHGMTHGYANLVAHEARSAAAGGPPPEADRVAAQYAGPKADLLPIYEAVVEGVRAFGADVEIAPKKTYVSLRRAKQFALVQPSTRTRVDVGLNLAGTEAAGRLEASGSFNAMVSHRVRLESVADVDDELLGWLRRAYEGA